jgi:cephalosporin hydroxylase
MVGATQPRQGETARRPRGRAREVQAMKTPVEQFEEEKKERLRAQGADAGLRGLSRQWFEASYARKYPYNFTWLGRPIIQYPHDVLAMQEIVWRVRPELIVETGIAHGGSLVLSASLLELLGGEGRVVGVDIDIRAHNRAALEAHPLFKRISLVEGSSVDPAVAAQVRGFAREGAPTMVVLDSNHTHEHVLEELRLYAPLVTPGSYLVVFDTVVEDLPDGTFPDRPWGPGNNPKTALHEYLKECDRFVVDEELESKLLITCAPGGYLRCVK